MDRVGETGTKKLAGKQSLLPARIRTCDKAVAAMEVVPIVREFDISAPILRLIRTY
jgi:hypothetical protein